MRNGFDVRIHKIRRRRNRRRQFEVRWHAAGRARSRSFATRGLAGSYRAELIRAARQGQEFGPATGEPATWAVPETPQVTWLEHAISYAAMKWPDLAPRSRASLADALATITPALTRPAARPPAQPLVRAALYQHAFHPGQHTPPPDPGTAQALAWLHRRSLPLASVNDPRIPRAALTALTRRQDGTRAAATTTARKHAVLHDTLAYAVELGLLPANPLTSLRWKAPAADTAIDSRTVPCHGQVQAVLAQVSRIRPELTAFFGCLYYAALRPEEAVVLRRADCHLPGHGWGTLILTTACPRTGSSWTSTGTPYEPRGLKHRPPGAIRIVPIPPVLVALIRWHLREHGTTPDGRLFRGTRGGMLSESLYGRTWHIARAAALGPSLAATALARRPYDLRHAGLTLWLTATSAPAETAARGGTSPRVLHAAYTHRLHGHDHAVNAQIERALRAPSPSLTGGGPADRYHRPPCPPYVRSQPNRPAHGPRNPSASHQRHSRTTIMP
jgi:integrase